ncbi:MAG: alpha/beta hydrolase [Paracoccaceae bacterium]
MAETTPDGTVLEIHGKADGPTVVLIHGLGLNRDCWQWMVPSLSDKYRVLTYDLYGHGDSIRPPETPSLTMFSRQLQGLLNHFNCGSAAIVGFSLGGMIVRRIAQDVPERVAAMAVLHSPHQRTPEAQAAIEKRVEQARTEGPSSTVEAALERWFTDRYRAQNPAMMDLVRSWVKANDISIYYTVYNVLATGIDEITAPTPKIICPTLVMTGDEDYGNGPEMTRAIASEIDGATVHVLPGLRHMALAEDPPAVNVPMRAFLDQVFSRGAHR